MAVPASTILLAVLLGLGVTLLFARTGARGRTSHPRENLAPAAMERRHRPWLHAGVGILLLLATVGLARLGPIGGRPLMGYAAAFTLLLATILFCPLTLRAFQGGVATALRGSRLVAARLAAGNLGRARRRNGVTLAAMTVGLAMLVGISTMIASFRQTVELWIDQTIRADLYLSRAGRLIRARIRGCLRIFCLRSAVCGSGPADDPSPPPARQAGPPLRPGAGDFDLMARRSVALPAGRFQPGPPAGQCAP
jgi:putative ABC transport system permease protein